MSIKIRFGKRIRRLRLAAGLSQQALAEATQLSPVSISNIERGICAPAFHRLQAFAHALRVEISELFQFMEDDDGCE